MKKMTLVVLFVFVASLVVMAADKKEVQVLDIEEQQLLLDLKSEKLNKEHLL